MRELNEQAGARTDVQTDVAAYPVGVPIRLVDAPAGATLRLVSGRDVVATGILIQGARFVRPVLDSDGRLGSMEVLHGDQLVLAN
jgi:hypothetical protein